MSKDAKDLRIKPIDAAEERRQSPVLSLVIRSALSTLLLVGVVAVAAYALPHGGAQSEDEISQSDAQARLEVFRELAPLNLSPVSSDEQDRALQSMNLSPGAVEALRTDLDGGVSPLQAPGAYRGAPRLTQPQAEVRAKRMQLVWITLWDTDAEDGDVVRIDSQGYFRTVRLTKKGDTFAIPVPADGVIKITGVRDGDGGGITVGLASGSARAVFPIMSEGQELGLKVGVN